MSCRIWTGSSSRNTRGADQSLLSTTTEARSHGLQALKYKALPVDVSAHLAIVSILREPVEWIDAGTFERSSRRVWRRTTG